MPWGRMFAQFIAAYIFLFILPRAGANSNEVRKFACLKKIFTERRTNQFPSHPMLKSFTYLLLFCFEFEDVHNLLTLQERETIFGEPFPQDGKQCENIRPS